MDAQPIGSNFKNNARGNLTLVTPAQNTTGMVLRTASLHIAAGFMILSTGTKAPSGYSDTSVPVVMACRGITGGNGFPGLSEVLPFPVIIPAGQGLWVASDSSDQGYAYITWDPLPAA